MFFEIRFNHIVRSLFAVSHRFACCMFVTCSDCQRPPNARFWSWRANVHHNDGGRTHLVRKATDIHIVLNRVVVNQSLSGWNVALWITRPWGVLQFSRNGRTLRYHANVARIPQLQVASQFGMQGFQSTHYIEGNMIHIHGIIYIAFTTQHKTFKQTLGFFHF